MVLPLEGGLGSLDFGDDVAARELGGAEALAQPFDGVEYGGSAAGTRVCDLGLQGRDGDGGPVDGVVAVRIV